MDPMTIVVLLVAFGVWVISNVLKNAGEVKKPGGGPIAARPRPAATDIDRFLEEINRRRQQQQPPPQQQPPARTPRAIPVESVEPPRQRQRPVQAKVIEKPKPKAKPVSQRPKPVVMARPVEPPPTARVYDMVPAPLGTSLDLPTPVLLAPVGLLGPTARGTPAPSRNELTRQVQGYFRNPVNLRAAFVLGEILGQPRCRKRHAPG
ncbi:MAG TPA: hypothetical protein PKD86_04650 [Gemmatales bacterium]|nr:hypothetical protein [Gemmatales bacterium]HMP58622.1 hypothetical protein [Gemmatales bacterium]